MLFVSVNWKKRTMSRSGKPQKTARKRSGRLVSALPTSRPPLLPPRIASRSGFV